MARLRGQRLLHLRAPQIATEQVSGRKCSAADVRKDRGANPQARCNSSCRRSERSAEPTQSRYRVQRQAAKPLGQDPKIGLTAFRPRGKPARCRRSWQRFDKSAAKLLQPQRGQRGRCQRKRNACGQRIHSRSRWIPCHPCHGQERLPPCGDSSSRKCRSQRPNTRSSPSSSR